MKTNAKSSLLFKLSICCFVFLCMTRIMSAFDMNLFIGLLSSLLLLLGFSILLILLLLSLIYALKNHKKIINYLLPLAFNLFSFFFIVFFPFDSIALDIDFRLKSDRREAVVRNILSQKKDILARNKPVVGIEAENHDLSAGEPKIIVEKIDNSLCVFFYTFRGVTDNFSGFVYVEDDSVINKIKLNSISSSSIFYNPIEITKMANHWYFVANT